MRRLLLSISKDEEECWFEALQRKNLDMESLDWRDKEDVDGVCKLLNVSTSNLGERNHVKSFLRRLSTPIYRVTASVGNARNVKGFRAATFLIAEETKAHFVPSEKPIQYGSGNKCATLFVSLLFNSYSDALDFSSKIRNWKSNLEDPVVGNIPARLPGRQDLRPVLLLGFDPTEADDSPCTSLADFRELSSALPTELVSFDNPLHNRLKRTPCLLLGRLHLKVKAKFKVLRDDVNNMVSGSWAFHQLFDGLDTSEDHRIPLLSMGWLESSDHAVQFEDGERRYKVDLLLEFFTEEAENDFKDSLKVGPTREKGRAWKTFVHVRDPDLFKECIQWKHDETVRLWDAHYT